MANTKILPSHAAFNRARGMASALGASLLVNDDHSCPRRGYGRAGNSCVAFGPDREWWRGSCGSGWAGMGCRSLFARSCLAMADVSGGLLHPCPLVCLGMCHPPPPPPTPPPSPHPPPRPPPPPPPPPPAFAILSILADSALLWHLRHLTLRASASLGLPSWAAPIDGGVPKCPPGCRHTQSGRQAQWFVGQSTTPCDEGLGSP